MPGTNKPRAPLYDYDDDRPPSADQSDRDTDNTKKQEQKSKDEDNKGDAKRKAGGSWIGGILNKLSLRPPNQMILPDDKNPSIVWDPETKRWRNLDGDGDEPDQPPPPPPKTSDLPHVMQSISPPLPAAASTPGAPPAGGPAPPVSNMFKMRNRGHIKKSYVDVFNPSGAPTRALPPAADVLGPSPALAAPTNYFVPAPAPAPLTQDSVRKDLLESIEVSIPSRAGTPTSPSRVSDTDSEKSDGYPFVTDKEEDMLAYRSGI